MTDAEWEAKWAKMTPEEREKAMRRAFRNAFREAWERMKRGDHWKEATAYARGWEEGVQQGKRMAATPEQVDRVLDNLPDYLPPND